MFVINDVCKKMRYNPIYLIKYVSVGKTLLIFSAKRSGQVHADRCGNGICMVKWGIDKPTGVMWKNEW